MKTNTFTVWILFRRWLILTILIGYSCDENERKVDAISENEEATVIEVASDGNTEFEEIPIDEVPAEQEVNDIEEETIQTYWHPHPSTSWQVQFSGTLDLSVDVQMFDLDLFETEPETINYLHSRGTAVVCYFSAGSYEDWRPDASSFPPEVLGNPLEGWPGERWLDIRSPLVRNIMIARMDMAVTKGCDGVDPDNVNGYVNDTGFNLTYDDQLAYNRFLSNEAHARKLAIGLKNDVEQIDDLLDWFDWQLNEECFTYNECELLTKFIESGKPVFAIEYGNETLADSVCPRSNLLNFDTLIKHLELDAWRIDCRNYN